MFRAVVHRIAADPRAYDCLQWLVGAGLIDRRIRERVAPVAPGSRILDVGGGTGAARRIWPAEARYTCLDQDRKKLRRFTETGLPGEAVVGDATQMPFAAREMDIVLCKFVSHHIEDADLDRLFAECRRVLRPGGRFVFVEAVWAPSSPIGRLLWKYDRGSHPRSPHVLREAIERWFGVSRWEQFAILHHYVLCIAIPRPTEG